jgi:DNA mismatch endonuclease (patch repair protein)
MRANRRRDTRPEVAVRSHLHRAGLRFFVDRPIRLADRVVRPDITFPRVRVAVFIDGCFWHACPEHGTHPRRNGEYWSSKLRRNVERDRLVNVGLAQAGWASVRHWEHESPEEVVAAVAAVVASRTSGTKAGSPV